MGDIWAMAEKIESKKIRVMLSEICNYSALVHQSIGWDKGKGDNPSKSNVEKLSLYLWLLQKDKNSKKMMKSKDEKY